MNFADLFKQTTSLLREKQVVFALAGGMVASIYRKQPRTTNDLDFLFFVNKNAEATARSLLKSLGLEPQDITKADLEGGPLFSIKGRAGPVVIVAGRSVEDPRAPGVDLLLPILPWFSTALERAQTNLCDFGFGAIPCLTVEDILLSKFYSLENNASRIEDLSDIRSILETDASLDLVYLVDQMRRLNIVVPRAAKNDVPEILRKTDKDIRKSLKKKPKTHSPGT